MSDLYFLIAEINAKLLSKLTSAKVKYNVVYESYTFECLLVQLEGTGSDINASAVALVLVLVTPVSWLRFGPYAFSSRRTLTPFDRWTSSTVEAMALNSC